jgi:hypothetical protein
LFAPAVLIALAACASEEQAAPAALTDAAWTIDSEASELSYV